MDKCDDWDFTHPPLQSNGPAEWLKATNEVYSAAMKAGDDTGKHARALRQLMHDVKTVLAIMDRKTQPAQRLADAIENAQRMAK